MMRTLLILATVLLSGAALAAGTGKVEKIDSSFESLDNNGDSYISQEEADDDNVWGYFTAIDINQDQRLSRAEFNSYIRANPGVVEGMEEEEEAE